MKTIQLIIATSILLTSLNASAESVTVRTESDTVFTTVAASKAQAYQLGMNQLAQLTSSSGRDLDRKLRVHSGHPDIDTLKVNDGAFVTIQERVSSGGKIEYIGEVNFDFSYDEIDDN